MMRYLKLYKAAIILFACSLIFFAEKSYAGNGRTDEARKTLSNLRKIERLRAKAARVFARANSAERSSVIDGEADDEDSDGDGLSDDLENISGSEVCDGDSDDDGADDKDELEEDTDPEDPEEGFLKAEGLITVLSETSITIGSLTCALNESTEYEKNEVQVDRSAFSVGDPAEIKCTLENVALEVEDEESASDDD